MKFLIAWLISLTFGVKSHAAIMGASKDAIEAGQILVAKYPANLSQMFDGNVPDIRISSFVDLPRSLMANGMASEKARAVDVYL